MIRLFIKDHQYSSWDYKIETDPDKIPSKIFPSPIEKRLLNNDVLLYDDVNCEYKMHYSPIRNSAHIPGVLILEGNKTYGRTKNRKRLLYKCIPDDKHLPHFLVPYDIIIDFSKIYKNKYILFKFQEWVDEHPLGMIVETIGDINNLEAFYEYQLYSKSLHSTLKDMTQKIKDMTKKKTMKDYFQEILNNPIYKIQDKTDRYVFTIDSTNTIEYDDALSIHQEIIDDKSITIVTVYVAQVVFWLELFQLWNSFDNRISTIYLPDRRRPMLPTILTDSLCSLKENENRFTIAMEFYIDSTNYKVIDTKIYNCMIRISNNYVYDDNRMVYKDKQYIQLFETTSRLDSRIKNSCELVSYWMVKMNSYIAQVMIQHKTGIYRIGKVKQKEIIEEDDETPEEKYNFEMLDPDTKKYIEYHAKAQSVLYRDDISLEHELMNKQVYLRITSAIRRYEDICNQRELMRIMGIQLRQGETINDFFNEEMCNEKYRSIRKVESESIMMKRICTSNEKYVKGILYSRRLLNDGRYHYKVYINGQGIKDIKSRTKMELYKEYELFRYVKERGGGMSIKVEII